MKNTGLIFEGNQITFNRYEFKTISSLKHNNIIKLLDINEIMLDTHPPSIVVNRNEILFIPENQKQDLADFAQKHQLKISKRYDIWSGLIEPFLEVQPNSMEQNNTNTTLLQNGLTKTEITDIRERLQKVMQNWGTVCWNRNYLGQYDLLLNKKEIYALHFPHNFYWWTMKIALKNL